MKWIFDMASNEKSLYEITLEINKQKIATAMTYYKTGRMKQIDGDLQWCKGTINKLLSNDVYVGDLIQGKKRQNLSKGVKQHFVSEDEYIIFKNAHEPIVDRNILKKN